MLYFINPIHQSKVVLEEAEACGNISLINLILDMCCNIRDVA